jgi:hypothetical protein
MCGCGDANSESRSGRVIAGFRSANGSHPDDLASRAKRALLQNFSGRTDEKGYVSTPEENVLPGLDLAAISDDLRRGDGDELGGKFRAIHSSAALAVNSFGRFKSQPAELPLLGDVSARNVEFEKPFRIFRGGRAPNLDVWVDRSTGCVAIESKCLEYFTRKQAHFSSAYERLAPPRAEECWWALYQVVKGARAQYLDCAQLLKHYFGLCAFRERNPGIDVTLLYLFWEPLNWRDIDVCLRHRQETADFAEAVAEARLAFRWFSYNELWEEWTRFPALEDHVLRLKARYQVEI